MTEQELNDIEVRWTNAIDWAMTLKELGAGVDVTALIAQITASIAEVRRLQAWKNAVPVDALRMLDNSRYAPEAREAVHVWLEATHEQD